MKSKKLRISLVVICLALLVGIIAWTIQSVAVNSVDYKIKIVRLRQNSGLGFAIQRTNGSVNNYLEILNLVGMNNNTAEERPLYCVQAGLGFYNADGTNPDPVVTYDKAFDMKLEADKKELNEKYGDNPKVEENKEENSQEENNKEETTETKNKEGLIIAKSSNDAKYSKVLWLADNMYVPGQDTAEDKIALLKKVGVINEDKSYTKEQRREILSKIKDQNVIKEEITDSLSDEEVDKIFFSECFISDDVMEAVQQLAFWYIIHEGDNGKKDNYHHETLPDLYYTNQEKLDTEATDKTSVYNNKKLEKYGNTISIGTGSSAIKFEIGKRYQENAAIYYKWIIDKVKDEGSYFDKVKYEDSEYARQIPVKVNDTVLKTEADGEDYIVGPYEIERIVKGDFTLNTEISANNYTVLQEDKKTTVENIKAVVGDEKGTYKFYLKIPKDQISELTVKFNAKSNNRLVTLLLGKDALSEQPVLFIDNKPEDYNKTVKLNTFDLALRKVITKVTDKDGKEKDIINIQKEKNARTVDVNTNNLNKTVDGNLVTTATYNHRKDPVLIETGDIVTYTITIYNEGNADGRATQVVDVLPDGLEFVRIVEGDYEVSNTLEDGSMPKDRIIFKKKGEDNLKAYSGSGELSSESIVIECKVTAKATAGNKVLTNIALISEAYNAETQTVITNQEKLDRDSEPFTAPTETVTREMDNYKGNSSNKDDLTDAKYFYQGEQDDDDFEKLVLKGANFDLSLRKYITEVETKNSKGESVKTQHDRAPKVDVSKLNTTVDGKLITTAEYNHTKNPVAVNVGDIVTYTIRVYNEGDVDGYVAEITDYLPQWLEFLPDDSLNKQYLWNYREEGNKRIISTPITAKDNKAGDTLYKDRKDGKLLRAFDPATMDTLDYIDVQIRCKVLESVNDVKLQPGEKVTNIAVITKMTDDTGSDIEKDRDSKVDYENIPSDENLPGYKDDEIESGKPYIPGQEDDMTLKK